MKAHFSPTVFVLAICGLLAGCGKKETAVSGTTETSMFKIRFQTDWYPQVEHGGFYQALAKGYYRDAGLDVQILSGGPGPTPQQKVVAGAADIAMSTSDQIIANVNSGLPFIIVGATMQHDPQAILVHAESPVRTFADLDGKSIMAYPGVNWIDYLRARYKINFSIIPLNYSLSQFMADKNFIQQCFITNEPYFAGKNGAKTRTLLISNSGFDAYRDYFTTRNFAREHPAQLRAFVAASTRGWDDFIHGDPAPAEALITKANPQMTQDFMNYSWAAMKSAHLIDGLEGDGDRVGLLRRDRLQKVSETLAQLKVTPAVLPVEKFADLSFLPETISPGGKD